MKNLRTLRIQVVVATPKRLRDKVTRAMLNDFAEKYFNYDPLPAGVKVFAIYWKKGSGPLRSARGAEMETAREQLSRVWLSPGCQKSVRSGSEDVGEG